MKIEHFLCWQCEKPVHYLAIAWHQVNPGQMELVCDACHLAQTQEKKAA